MPLLSFLSPPTAKLVVITSPRSTPGSGPVVVETIKGGTGVSSIKFTFVSPDSGKTPVLAGLSGVVSAVENYSPFVVKRRTKVAG